MLAIAAGIEVAYAYAWKMNGYSTDTLAKYGSPQFFAVSPSFPESHYSTYPSSPVLPSRPRHRALRSLLPHRQSRSVPPSALHFCLTWQRSSPANCSCFIHQPKSFICSPRRPQKRPSHGSHCHSTYLHSHPLAAPRCNTLRRPFNQSHCR